MIGTYIVTTILMVVSLILQTHTSFDSVRIFNTKIDLVFIVTVYMGYSFGSFYGQVTGFIGGLLQDSLSLTPLGMNAFSKMSLGFIVGMFGREIIQSNLLTVSILVFVASIIKGVITLMLCYIFNEGLIDSTIRIILPEAFINGLFSPILFYVFDKLFASELEREEY